MEKNIESLWDKYFNNNDSINKKNLMMNYIWLVKYTIQGMNLPSKSILTYDDFINIGILGLNESIERFDIAKGAKFETYAVTRIKGTILDELRKLDWLSRTTRKRAKDLQNAEDEIRKYNNGEATVEQVIKKLNININDYQSYRKAAEAAKANQYLFETTQGMLGEDDFDILEEVPDPSVISALDKLEEDERIQNISKILADMNEKKRLVISLYYYEELNFKEIGNFLQLTESRVCQIHNQVLKEIRQKLNSFENA